MRRLVGGLLPLLVAACTPSAVPPPSPAAAAAAPAQEAGAPGRGTLRQDEFTISLRSGALLVKATPLQEEVIRLAAPDTYERLRALAASRRAEAVRATGSASPGLFLVSFFSYQPDTRFQPEDLQLVSGGRLLRPRAIFPLTPGWGTQRLEQQEAQSAIYVFEPGIDLELSLLVRYGFAESDQWSRILPRLRVERDKVRARAG